MSNDSGEIQFNIGRKHLADFYYRFLPEFKKYGSVKGAESRDILQYLPPEAKFAFYLDADEENLTCEIKAVYGENTVDVTCRGGSAEDFRDLFKEHEIMDQVMQYFPEVDESGSVFHCGREEALIYQVLDQGIEALMTLGEVNSTDRFKRLSIRRMPKVSVGVSMESGLMDLSITLDDMTREELLEVLKSYRRKKKYFRLKNGDFVNIEEDSVEILGQMMDALHLSPKEFVQGKMQLPVYRALYLDKMLEQSSGIYLKRDSHFRKLVKDFKTVTDSDYEVPEMLQDTMRQYQTEGYKWLRTVESGGFGGILADDMGLGKTLQMIAVFLAWKQEGQKGTSLKVAHIEWYKITGETAKEKRIELVRDFNEGTVPVFLISLKAGGTGLNLTGADVVIHYDPWWNLAVQNQATDRAHRIGQKNIVTVYKLIVKNSIEEKILEMQEAKKHLADEILSGEMGGLSALTKDELMALLKI